MPRHASSTPSQQAFLRRCLAELGLSRPRLATALGVDLARLKAWMQAPDLASSRRMPLRAQQKLRGLLQRHRKAQAQGSQNTAQHWQAVKAELRKVQPASIAVVRMQGEIRFYQLMGPDQSRTFSCRRFGSPQQALAQAQATAKALGWTVGSGITGQVEGALRANSPTSAAGITFRWLDRASGPALHVVVAVQTPDGRTKGNMYSVNRHGLDGAIDMAIALRTQYGAPMPNRHALLRELQAEYRTRAAGLPPRRVDRAGVPVGRGGLGVAGLRPHWRRGADRWHLIVKVTFTDTDGRARQGGYDVRRWGMELALDKAIALRTSVGAPVPDRRALLKTLREFQRAGPPTALGHPQRS